MAQNKFNSCLGPHIQKLSQSDIERHTHWRVTYIQIYTSTDNFIHKYKNNKAKKRTEKNTSMYIETHKQIKIKTFTNMKAYRQISIFNHKGKVKHTETNKTKTYK